MRVILLGTGTPTHPRRFQTSVLVNANEVLLLFDAGRGTVHQMYQAGVAVERIQAIFITHHHFDHINDLFDVIISSAMRGREHVLPIYGPPGTEEIVWTLVNKVYARDIRFRLEEHREITRRGGQWNERPEAITRLKVQDIRGGDTVKGGNWRVCADEVVHGIFPHAPDFDWLPLGYRVEAEGKVLAISGDAVPCEGLLRLAQGADMLIQCCHFPQRLANTPARAYLTESILPTTTQAGQIAAQAQVTHLVLTHLSPLMDDVGPEEILADIRQAFSGPVSIGSDLLSLEV